MSGYPLKEAVRKGKTLLKKRRNMVSRCRWLSVNVVNEWGRGELNSRPADFGPIDPPSGVGSGFIPVASCIWSSQLFPPVIKANIWWASLKVLPSTKDLHEGAPYISYPPVPMTLTHIPPYFFYKEKIIYYWFCSIQNPPRPCMWEYMDIKFKILRFFFSS